VRGCDAALPKLLWDFLLRLRYHQEKQTDYLPRLAKIEVDITPKRAGIVPLFIVFTMRRVAICYTRVTILYLLALMLRTCRLVHLFVCVCVCLSVGRGMGVLDGVVIVEGAVLG